MPFVTCMRSGEVEKLTGNNIDPPKSPRVSSINTGVVLSMIALWLHVQPATAAVSHKGAAAVLQYRTVGLDQKMHRDPPATIGMPVIAAGPAINLSTRAGPLTPRERCCVADTGGFRELSSCQGKELDSWNDVRVAVLSCRMELELLMKLVAGVGSHTLLHPVRGGKTKSLQATESMLVHFESACV